MVRIHYVRVVVVAVAVTAISMVGIVLGDSQMVEAAGLDVWNVGRLEDQLRAANVTSERLIVQQDANQSQFQLNRTIVYDVINGKRKLHDAAEQLWKMNGHTHGYMYVIPTTRSGPTIIAKVAHNIIALIVTELQQNPIQRIATIHRLRAEYEATYGVPAPTVD